MMSAQKSAKAFHMRHILLLSYLLCFVNSKYIYIEKRWEKKTIQGGSQKISNAKKLNKIKNNQRSKVDFSNEVKNEHWKQVEPSRNLETKWNKLGQDIYGKKSDRVKSISLSGDGLTVALGSPSTNQFKGKVSINRINENGTWIPLGEDFEGDNQFDQFGKSISLSKDGNILAISKPGNGGRGLVCVFELINSQWKLLGEEIEGKEEDEIGQAISLSENGRIIAISSYKNNDFTGNIRVYELNNNTKWEPIGKDINGENKGDWFGWAISLAGDGSTIAGGGQNNDGNTGVENDNRGHVRVFTLVDGEWESLGKDINGEKSNDFSGSALTLSSDGRILAIGATFNNGPADDDFDERGHVRVFKLNNKNKWKPLGNDIDGESLGDNSGSSVSLSANGTILAIGAPLNDGSADNRYDERGHVRVFRLNEKDQWDQVGTDIDGESKDDEMGSYVSLSSDGLTLAVGVPFDDDSVENAGFVRVFKLSDSMIPDSPAPSITSTSPSVFTGTSSSTKPSTLPSMTSTKPSTSSVGPTKKLKKKKKRKKSKKSKSKKGNKPKKSKSTKPSTLPSMTSTKPSTSSVGPTKKLKKKKKPKKSKKSKSKKGNKPKKSKKSKSKKGNKPKKSKKSKSKKSKKSKSKKPGHPTKPTKLKPPILCDPCFSLFPSFTHGPKNDTQGW